MNFSQSLVEPTAVVELSLTPNELLLNFGQALYTTQAFGVISLSFQPPMNIKRWSCGYFKSVSMIFPKCFPSFVGLVVFMVFLVFLIFLVSLVFLVFLGFPGFPGVLGFPWFSWFSWFQIFTFFFVFHVFFA